MEEFVVQDPQSFLGDTIRSILKWKPELCKHALQAKQKIEGGGQS